MQIGLFSCLMWTEIRLSFESASMPMKFMPTEFCLFESSHLVSEVSSGSSVEISSKIRLSSIKGICGFHVLLVTLVSNFLSSTSWVKSTLWWYDSRPSRYLGHLGSILSQSWLSHIHSNLLQFTSQTPLLKYMIWFLWIISKIILCKLQVHHLNITGRYIILTWWHHILHLFWREYPNRNDDIILP